MVKKINIQLQSIETKVGYQWGKMWVTGRKMMKNKKKGNKKTKKVYPKWLIFVTFFLPTGESGGIKLSLRDKCPQVPSCTTIFHKKKIKKNNILHSICVTDLGQLKTLSFPGPNRKGSVVGGHFSVFLGRVRSGI